MADFESRTMENIAALTKVMGAENVSDVQKRIGDLIVGRVEDDLRHYDMYLFYPGDYKESIEEAFEKVQKKITKMYADAMLDVAEKAVNKFKEVALKSLESENLTNENKI